MQIAGRIWKEGKYWAVECPTLDAHTQGTSRRDGLEMIKDWVREMSNAPDLDVEVTLVGDEAFTLAFSDPGPILGLIVAQQRNVAGKTLQEVADEIGNGNRSAIKQAESGRSELGISRLVQILGAFGLDICLTVVPKVENSAASSVPERRRESA